MASYNTKQAQNLEPSSLRKYRVGGTGKQTTGTFKISIKSDRTSKAPTLTYSRSIDIRLTARRRQ